MDVATEPFNARELRIVKKKINLLHDPSIRSARLFRLAFQLFAAAGRRHFRLPGCGVLSYFFVSTGVLLRTPAIP
jgi:hypothetical protein